MDIRQIEYFIEVCRCMSFTRAAENLYISQQGMSQSIKRLEGELGVKLFNRTTSSLELTQYAECFLPYAKELIRNYNMARGELISLQSINAGQLRVGIAHGLVNIMPSQLFAEYSRSNPELTVSLSEYSDFELDRALLDRKVDVAFCIMPVDMSAIAVHHVHRENTYYMLGESHRLAGRRYLDLPELKGELFMGFGVDNKGHFVFSERCRRAGFEPRFGMVSQDMNLIEEMCRNSMSIGFYVGDPGKQIPGIKIIPDKNESWPYDIAICTNKDEAASKAVKKFIDAMKSW